MHGGEFTGKTEWVMQNAHGHLLCVFLKNTYLDENSCYYSTTSNKKLNILCWMIDEVGKHP
jgi:hypothetical protein